MGLRTYVQAILTHCTFLIGPFLKTSKISGNFTFKRAAPEKNAKKDIGTDTFEP